MIGDQTTPEDFIQVITPQGTNVEIVGLIRDINTSTVYLQTNG